MTISSRSPRVSSLPAMCLLCLTLQACSSGTARDGGGTTGGTTTGGSTGGLSLGSPCMATATYDPCGASGYACGQLVYSDGGLGPATCAQPFQAFLQCNQTVGCCCGLSCLPGFAGADGGTQSLCAQECVDQSGCPDATQACTPHTATQSACLPTSCGPDVMNGPGAYLSCTVSQQDDGTCLPFGTQANGTLSLICALDGPIAQDQPCSGTRNDDGGTDGLCQAGLFCTLGSGTNSACEPLCAVATPPSFADGGPGCAGNASCYGLTASDLSFGVCLQSCGSGTCPGVLSCTNGVCQP
jgi:hypothetical protein